jgi:hypothetical protein
VALLQHPADPEILFDNGVGDAFSSRCFDKQLRARSNGFLSLFRWAVSGLTFSLNMILSANAESIEFGERG